MNENLQDFVSTFQQFREGSLLERMAASPLSEQAIQNARETWGISG